MYKFFKLFMSYFNKIIFLFLTVFFLGSNISQISITNSDFSSSSSKHIFSEISIDQSIDFQTSAASYSWDFSNVQYLKQDSLLNEDVSSTPFLYQFYFNNFLLYPDYLASYAQDRTDFSDPLGVLSLSDNFNYFKLSSSSLRLVGFGTTISLNGSPGIPTSVRYDTIDQIYPLPLTYGLSDSTSAYYLTSIPSFGSYGQAIKRKVEVDGWGNLTTPYSNYDVLRVKTTLYQTDTFYVDTFQFGNSVDRPTLEIYEWWAKNIGFPVLRVEYQNNLITQGWYADQLHVGYNNLFNEELLIFPNPTTDQLFLNINDNCTADYFVYNTIGHLVKKGKTNGEIYLKNIPNGFYLIMIEIEQKLKVFKIQKI
jgi:hypothetical protein